MLDGEAHRLGGFGQIRSASIEESPAECSFVLPGKDIVVRGRVSAPKKDFVGWVYADPKGPEHNTINCSVADLELTVERPALPPRSSPSPPAPPTSSACARPTTASRSSPIRTAERPQPPTPPPGRDEAVSPPPPTTLPFTTLRKLIQRARRRRAPPRAGRRGSWSRRRCRSASPRRSGRDAALGDDDPLQPAVEVGAELGADLRPAEFRASSCAAGRRRRRGRGRRPGRGSGGPKKTFWTLSVWPPEQAEK